MITEDYVSFEIAKLLKEKGFDNDVICTDCWYNEDGDLYRRGNYSYSGAPVYHKDTCCNAPTLQMAMKWLREVHHWYIFVLPKWEDVEYMPGELEEKIVGYQYIILPVGNVNVKYNYRFITSLTPESAGEAAIKYCLENLI